MKIATRLKISALVPVLMALVIGLALFFSIRIMDRAQDEGNAARQIMQSMNAINGFTRHYISYQEERAKLQFLTEYDSISKLISEITFRDEHKQRVLGKIRHDSESMREAFLKMVSIYENPGSAQNQALLREAEERLAGRILVRASEALSDAVHLDSLIHREITATQRRISALVFLLIVCTTLPLTIVLIRMMSEITKALAMLRKGTEFIASGNLDHRIGMAASDEIGELSCAFDLMTKQLKDTTVSRDELSREVEERRRAQEELHRSREWFRVTLGSIGDAVIATDSSGLVTYMNPVGSELTGWHSDKASGQPIRNVFRIINEKTRQPAENIVERVLSEGCTVNLANHTALITLDGREIPIEDSAAPIRDGTGNIIGVVLVFHDVTEKRLAQEALRESEHRYRILFETMSEGFALHEIVCDEQGRPCDYRFLDVNPAFERQTGLKAADLINRTLLEVIPRAEPFWIERYGRVALSGVPDHFEHWSGELGRWYDVRAFQTEPGRFATVFLNITERKKAEEALRDAAEKFRIVADFTYDWEYWRRPENQFLYMSPSCERITGYSRDEFMKDPQLYSTIIHPDDRERVLAHMSEDQYHHEPCELEFRILHRNGRERWIGHACQPVLDEKGQLLGRRSSNRDITERKTMEEERERLLAERTAVMEGIADGLTLADLTGRIIYHNPASLAIHGCSCMEESLLPKDQVLTQWEILDLEGQPVPAEEWPMPRALQGDTFSGYELCARHRDKERQFIGSYSGKLICDAAGKPLFAMLIIRDITDRKRAEDALRQSEQRLRLASSAAQLGVFEWDVPTDTAYWENERMYEIFGRAHEEGPLSNAAFYSEVIEPQDQLVFERALKEAMRQDRLFHAVCRIRRCNDGQQRWIEFSGRFDLAADGSVQRLVGVTADITERKQAEETLRKSQLLYRTLASNLPGGAAFVVDPNLRYLLAEGEALRYVGMAPGDLEGKTLTEALDPELAAGHEANYRKAMAGEPFHMEHFSHGRHFISHGVPLRNDAGEVYSALAVSYDITERKRMEEELRKSRDELEIRVQERTAELQVSNKALMEYAAKLERLNEELQDFAFVAAHDLQEPLRKIQTFCDMAMKRCTLNGTGLEYLERVVSSAGRMRQLLRDLLQFSRVAVRPEPFKEVDLGRIAQEAADLFEEDLKESGGLIEIENMPQIEADADQMLRLFQNLIGNSLKYRSVESPRIKIDTRLDARECEIMIEDNGIGFDQQFAERIFKPFQRLHGRKEYEGTGMGLAICRKIVEWHGGSIRAESQPGKGSTFIVRLPVRQ